MAQPSHQLVSVVVALTISDLSGEIFVSLINLKFELEKVRPTFSSCNPFPSSPSVGAQRSNAVRVRNMNRFDGGKSPGNSKHFLKTSKDKAVPGKRSFKR